MKWRVWSALALSVALSAGACAKEPTAPTQPAQPANGMSAQASSYLNEVVGIMQANSIKRLTIDWTTFRSTVFAQAAGAQTIAATMHAIQYALALLGDGHSQYYATTGTVLFVPNRSCSVSPPAGTPTLPGTIGYVKVGAFSGSGAQATSFAEGIQTAIRTVDRDNLIGWVVDLRGNGGGNMWPMLAGLGPIIGDGQIGYFINPLGSEELWEYRDGASWLRGIALVRVTTPYRLLRERPRVAVLTDAAVVSSGEATAIAFRQRQDTRSFGGPTCGLSTANQVYTLSDGGQLVLTVSVMADRTKNKYGDRIAPDETLLDPALAVQRAVEWLQTGR